MMVVVMITVRLLILLIIIIIAGHSTAQHKIWQLLPSLLRNPYDWNDAKDVKDVWTASTNGVCRFLLVGGLSSL